MNIAVDLHSHSGYAGGVGKLSLLDLENAMRLKGIDVFATGDCIHPARARELSEALVEAEEGLFRLPDGQRRFLLQTEIILSVQLPRRRNRTVAHHVLLLPDFAAIEKAQQLMDRWNQKNTIGRPFVVCTDRWELEDRLFELADIDPLVEIIPAHIMTPDGVYGGKNNLDSLEEFYGRYTPEVRAIETGLSADPDMLCRIPDLAELTYVSSSDCHSAALHRVGREFTILDAEEMSYPAIIRAIRDNSVAFTAEFHPSEGRYFLTGHRADRQGHDIAIVYDKAQPPHGNICPICGKAMLTGVRDRCRQLSDSRVKPLPRKFLHLAPLVEVIARSLGLKSVSGKRVMRLYDLALKPFGSEIALWRSDKLEELLDKQLPAETLQYILAVRRGHFRFDPPGFDGCYGELTLQPERMQS